MSEQRPRAVQFRVELPGGEPHYHVYIPGQFFEDYPDPTAIARELREGKVAETMVAQGPRSVTTVFGKER